MALSNDLKLARLIETFNDIDISFVESLIEHNPNASLKYLIQQCKNHQNNINNDSNNESNTCMISSEAVCIGCDAEHIETLDNIQYSFHYLFDQYISNTYLFKLIDIFHHLTIMREEYKYNNQNINQLNICIKTIYNFMNNIYKNPNKEKYRRIRESNQTFQRKVGQIQGSKLLLTLCGWIYIQMDKHNKNNGSYSSIYLFESSTSIDFIESVVQFLNQYMKHPKILILPRDKKDLNNIISKYESKEDTQIIIETTESKSNIMDIKPNKPMT
eukprot:264111_1